MDGPTPHPDRGGGLPFLAERFWLLAPLPRAWPCRHPQAACSRRRPAPSLDGPRAQGDRACGDPHAGEPVVRPLLRHPVRGERVLRPTNPQAARNGKRHPIFDQFGYVPGNGVDAQGFLQPFHLLSDPPTDNGETTNDITHAWGPQHQSWDGGRWTHSCRARWVTNPALCFAGSNIHGSFVDINQHSCEYSYREINSWLLHGQSIGEGRGHSSANPRRGPDAVRLACHGLHSGEGGLDRGHERSDRAPGIRQQKRPP